MSVLVDPKLLINILKDLLSFIFQFEDSRPSTQFLRASLDSVFNLDLSQSQQVQHTD